MEKLSNTEIYTKEELELFNQLENDVNNNNYKPLENAELQNKKEFFKQVATNTIEKKTKKKSYNLRLIENDVNSIKSIALEKGLPYQTFIASIIHQVATRQIKV
jgi:predicted DNA binding CopG/RHH family protein